MSWQPQVNRDDALYNSGVFGWETDFLNRIPPQYATNTTNGGSISTDMTGAVVDAGSTAGATASISTVNQSAMNHFNGKLHAIVYGSFSNTGTPFTNEYKIGTFRPYPYGVYVDLKTEEICINQDTTPLTNSIGSFSTLYFHSVIDYEQDTTRVEIQTDDYTQVAETNFMAVQGSGANTIVSTESNGASEEWNLLYNRIALVP